MFTLTQSGKTHRFKSPRRIYAVADNNGQHVLTLILPPHDNVADSLLTALKTHSLPSGQYTTDDGHSVDYR